MIPARRKHGVVARLCARGRQGGNGGVCAGGGRGAKGAQRLSPLALCSLSHLLIAPLFFSSIPLFVQCSSNSCLLFLVRALSLPTRAPANPPPHLARVCTHVFVRRRFWPASRPAPRATPSGYSATRTACRRSPPSWDGLWARQDASLIAVCVCGRRGERLAACLLVFVCGFVFCLRWSERPSCRQSQLYEDDATHLGQLSLSEVRVCPGVELLKRGGDELRDNFFVSPSAGAPIYYYLRISAHRKSPYLPQ